MTITECHYLCTLAPLGLADLCAPFFAGENEPSAKNSSSFSRPFASSMPRMLCQAANRAPCSCHHCKRRQQVLPDGKCLGMSLYLAPLRRSQRRPSRQARLGAGICPPLLERGGSGKRGESFFHRLSDSSCPVVYDRFCIKSQEKQKRMIQKYSISSNRK